jgi:hypothetical protein
MVLKEDYAKAGVLPVPQSPAEFRSGSPEIKGAVTQGIRRNGRALNPPMASTMRHQSRS